MPPDKALQLTRHRRAWLGMVLLGNTNRCDS